MSAATWVDHLRAGGTTRWRDWSGTAGIYPSVAHLEVLRRLNMLGASTELADCVLAAPVTGRDWRRDPLPGEAAAPDGDLLEPDDLPAADLLRVCAAAIARCAVHAAPAEPVPPPERSRMQTLLRHTPWTVAGSSATADATRDALRATGHPEGRKKSTVLVIAGPIEDLMAGHWHRRAMAGASLRWRRVWEVSAGRSRLPATVDPLALARRWSQRVGHQRVHVVLDPDPAPVIADVLGVDVTVRSENTPTATELMRRINLVLGELVDAEEHEARIPALAAAIPRSPEGLLGVPLDHSRWAAEQADQIAEGLASGPWTVHGPPQRIAPDARPRRRTVDPADTLDLALLTLLSGPGDWRTDG